MRPPLFMLLFCLCLACTDNKRSEKVNERLSDKVKLMTLDPGHFHAALVQKTMYDRVDSVVHVFAPEGPEVEDFLDKINSYNNREENRTTWRVKTHLGEDYLDQMLNEKPGNVMVVAGKNSKKIDYILEAVKAGLNVYADKPLVINPNGYEKLKQAFGIAKKNNVLIYDIMTERFEVTTMMQKLLSSIPGVFGEMVKGTPADPAISKESVHHFFKYVSGQPLVRPAWFFDVDEEGEGIVDVTTHLVDLIQWEVFPNQIVDTSEVEIISARRWPTVLTKEEFQKVTGIDKYPDYLKKDVSKDGLKVFCNGEMVYRIKDTYAKVSVAWNYQAPKGTGDKHYSIMRGTKCNLIIKQGEAEKYKPTLYVESLNPDSFEMQLNKAMETSIAAYFPGVSSEKISKTEWKINIPEKYKIGHEAHFAQVTRNYLKYLEQGELPVWEVPNMITKYYTTIEAYKMAKQ